MANIIKNDVNLLLFPFDLVQVSQAVLVDDQLAREFLAGKDGLT